MIPAEIGEDALSINPLYTALNFAEGEIGKLLDRSGGLLAYALSSW